MQENTNQLHYYTLGGEALEVPEQPLSVVEARKQLAVMLKLKHPNQIVLHSADGHLQDGAAFPQGGTIQVQIVPPPEHTWFRMQWDADCLDEEALRKALDKAFPPSLSEIDFYDDPPPNWRPQQFWSEDELWAKWTSAKMRMATIRTVGKWADYWRFAEMADTYGYWMVEAPYWSKLKTIDLIVSNVRHWRSLLKDLDATFASLHERTKGMNVAEVWEIAAAELLKYSPRFRVKTSFKYGFETWYWPFVQTLEWFADFADLDVHPRSFKDGQINYGGKGGEMGLFQRMLTPWGDGIFSSYSVKADGAKQFAEQMAKHHGVEFESFDATAQWLEQRTLLEKVVAKNVADVIPCQDDAHFQYIVSVDASRSSERAERLKEALHILRRDAKTEDRLTIELMSRWQAVVLGEARSIDMRSTDAYAKAGRERYPHYSNLRTRFEEVLSDATNSENDVAPEVRAARAYLDVCFFHPFDDGNGRLARLVLDFILSKAGLCLRNIGGLFGLSRRADDGIGAKAFVETIQQYIAPLGSNRDDDLKKWSAELKNTGLIEPPKRKAYEWFDCITGHVDLDRE